MVVGVKRTLLGYGTVERTVSWTLEELSRWTNELRDVQNLDFPFSRNWWQSKNSRASGIA
jgi:hypothetical protein